MLNHIAPLQGAGMVGALLYPGLRGSTPHRPGLLWRPYRACRVILHFTALPLCIKPALDPTTLPSHNPSRSYVGQAYPLAFYLPYTLSPYLPTPFTFYI